MTTDDQRRARIAELEQQVVLLTARLLKDGPKSEDPIRVVSMNNRGQQIYHMVRDVYYPSEERLLNPHDRQHVLVVIR